MKKHTCVVPGCNSADSSDDSLKFHQIPKEVEGRKKWLKAINLTEPEINKKSRVCSKHFKTQDYAITKFNYTMGGKNTPSGSEIKALKSEAVPNQNLPQKSTFKIKISKKDSGKQIKVEEVKVKEEKVEKEKPEKPEKVRMPKRPAVEMSPPRARTQSRRAASKEALKQMQLLLDDENDAVEIHDEDVIPIDPSPPPPPPPKKKYKLSHRKSSDGNDRDVIVLKSITNRNAENTLELDCWVEQLEEVQKNRIKKYQEQEKELQAKLDSLISQCNAKVVHTGDLNTIIEVSEQVQSAIQGAQAPATSLIMNNNLGGQQNYQLVMDPRMGLVVGAVGGASQTPQQKVYQGKVQVAQNLQQPTTPAAAASPGSQPTPTRAGTRGRNRGSASKIAAPPPVVTPTRSTQARATTTPQTRNQAAAAPQTRTQNSPQTRTQAAAAPQTRTTAQTRGQAVAQTRAMNQQGKKQAAPTAANTRQVAAPTTRQVAAAAVPAANTRQVASAAPAANTRQVAAAAPAANTRQVAAAIPAAANTRQGAVNTRGRAAPATNTFTTAVRPDETNVQGGLATGGKKVVVDLTTEDSNKGAPDSREISFNKLQGKTYPSLVVVARPHLRVQDLSVDRPKLDAKVKSVLMHAPTKFTEWLIQQGLIRSEQKCTVHATTQLKLGMYSDVSKFPYSGGYVWISECCPQRFVSVFSGSLFEGSPHPPMIILKLLYHWSCQTNIQNVTQWVKVDNLYVKGMFTWLRSICTVAIHTHIRQLGGPGVKVEVGVISLGTTSQDGNQRQVKVEVLGVLESDSKLIRLRAVEPQAEGDRNYKKRFSKILEPVCRWVHPQSILVADLTVDKQTLINMGFQNVVQYSSNQYGNNNQIMEYLRRIVPRMFQNTLSLLSRQIIQQFLDELVWREWFGTSALQAFDNLITHLSEQTRFEAGQSLIVRLNKVAQNPFKSWAVTVSDAPKTVETPATANATNNTNKKQGRNIRKPDPPKVTPTPPQEVQRPPKSTSPDVPEQMVPLESYYYGTIDTYSKTPTIVLNMKCPFCKSTFDNNIQLMSHLFKHAHNVSMDAQLCRYCLTSVATANDLLKHIASSHPAETKFDNGFCCLICETQYMNPFVLGKHMSKEHYPSELPYQCGTCSYRCSNHKQAIDHFYRTHDNGPTIQCPFCLKSTTVFTASRNIVQNMNYFIQHLQKHQRKQFARRCGKCNLWFVQKDVLKDHQNKMHVSQRGKNGLVPWTAPRNGIMVPKSKMDKYPVDAEVINFAALKFDLSKGLMCKECNTAMDTPKHFPSFESCQNPNCQYSTCCTNAMQEHNAKCSKTNNPVAPEKLPFEMFCICGHSDIDGNQMARHLAICERKSAYPSKKDSKTATVTHSMLDVLGLVRKPEEKPKSRTKKLKSDNDSGTTDHVTTLDSPNPLGGEDADMVDVLAIKQQENHIEDDKISKKEEIKPRERNVATKKTKRMLKPEERPVKKARISKEQKPAEALSLISNTSETKKKTRGKEKKEPIKDNEDKSQEEETKVLDIESEEEKKNIEITDDSKAKEAEKTETQQNSEASQGNEVQSDKPLSSEDLKESCEQNDVEKNDEQLKTDDDTSKKEEQTENDEDALTLSEKKSEEFESLEKNSLDSDPTERQPEEPESMLADREEKREVKKKPVENDLGASESAENEREDSEPVEKEQEEGTCEKDHKDVEPSEKEPEELETTGNEQLEDLEPSEKEPEKIKSSEKDHEDVEPSEKYAEELESTRTEQLNVAESEKEPEELESTRNELLEAVEPPEKDPEELESTRHEELEDVEPSEKEPEELESTRHEELEDVEPSEKEPEELESTRHEELEDVESSEKDTEELESTRHEELEDVEPSEKDPEELESTRNELLEDVEPPEKDPEELVSTRHEELEDVEPSEKDLEELESTRHELLEDAEPPEKDSEELESTRHEQLEDLDHSEKVEDSQDIDNELENSEKYAEHEDASETIDEAPEDIEEDREQIQLAQKEAELSEIYEKEDEECETAEKDNEENRGIEETERESAETEPTEKESEVSDELEKDSEILEHPEKCFDDKATDEFATQEELDEKESEDTQTESTLEKEHEHLENLERESPKAEKKPDVEHEFEQFEKEAEPLISDQHHPAEPTEETSAELQNHIADRYPDMETSEIPKDKEPGITSDYIEDLLSDVVGDSDETSAMETGSDGKTEDVTMASPTELMDVPDVGAEAPTPMETD